MILPIHPQALSDERIDRMASELGLRVTLPEQREFLRDTASLHLQAAPGSGKTSLVALKLALMAETWTSRTQGICVLSHTNIATEEIRQRVAVSSSGRRLLNHPHFIGTIQTFVHTFLALPNLRSRGVEVQAVDDDMYAAHAARFYQYGSYHTLRGSLGRLYGKGLGIVTESTYVFDSASGQLRVVPPSAFGAHTESYKQLSSIKDSLYRRGVLTYKDMFAIADQTLHESPLLAAAMRFRFPFVLIDEMQDTEQTQEDLLLRLFGEGHCVLQCVGDINQYIYTSDTGEAAAAHFPAEAAVDLPVSQRFGPEIGEVASRLTARRRQTIRGVGPEGTLVMITFNEASALNVIPAFELLASDHIPQEVLRDDPPRVLGARVDPGQSKLFPKSITCYAPEHAAHPARVSRGRLIAAVRLAQLAQASGARAASALWDTLRELSRTITMDHPEGHTATPLPALSRLDRTPGQAGHKVRTVLHKLLTLDFTDAEPWYTVLPELPGPLTELTGIFHGSPSEAVRAEWLTHTPLSAPLDRVQRAPGIVPAKIGTIAGSKGETHSATLLLECANRAGQKHDLASVLPLILGSTDIGSASASDRQAAQLAFVAVTRPRYLLALAMHEDRVAMHREALQTAGWLVLPAPNSPVSA
ncbi:UvrD-helicase domain-containing protein [Streptacidiphilus sp. N1-10]|uniref:UvrD-helicase domain-containing protein n=1 Tax=Streptacidiphilus jeojiensis TaxID=3229225 RepID=A0ABV6XY06_9ACTN